MIGDGVGGLVVDDHRDMAAALEQALRLDPLACRRDVEERFSPERMVERYLAAFEHALHGELERVA